MYGKEKKGGGGGWGEFIPELQQPTLQNDSCSPHVRKNGLKYLQQKSYCMHQIKAAKISVQNNLGHSNTRNNGVICIFLTAKLHV